MGTQFPYIMSDVFMFAKLRRGYNKWHPYHCMLMPPRYHVVRKQKLVEIIYIVVMYVYVNKSNTKIGIQNTLKDYGKHIANVSISNVHNMK